jgi:hypothetical protein
VTDDEVEQALAEGLPLALVGNGWAGRVMVRVLRPNPRPEDGVKTWKVRSCSAEKLGPLPSRYMPPRPFDRNGNAFVPACDLQPPTAEELLTLDD